MDLLTLPPIGFAYSSNGTLLLIVRTRCFMLCFNPNLGGGGRGNFTPHVGFPLIT